MPESKPEEILVIGAGLGGLAAACDLAAAGARVTVLERHSLPGGFATSFNRGRFEFETSLHEVADTAAVQYLKEIVPGLDFLNVPEAYRVILTGKGVDFTAPFGLEQFVRAVAAEVPGSEDSVRRFMNLCSKTFEAFGYLGENPRPSVKKLLGEYGDFLRTGSAVLDEVADAVDLPEKVRDIIYPYWCYIGVPSNKVSFSIWASMVYTYLNYGAVIPSTRSHGISVAMAEYISSRGGTILYNTEVKRLKTLGRRITGVILADGREMSCSRCISNISPHRIFGSFLSGKKLPSLARKSVNVRKPGISFFVLYLGLDASMEDLGIHDYSWFIAPDMDTVDLKRKMSDRNEPDPMIAAVCLNAADPEASPPGTCILSMTVGTQPEAWQDVKAEDYFREKSLFAARVIEQFEKATGIIIRNNIEEMETAAPPTFARYVGSWDGRVYGYEPFPWDGVIPRVLSRNRERFFRNLRFCGGNAYRALGYASSILSGRTAAELTLKEMD